MYVDTQMKSPLRLCQCKIMDSTNENDEEDNNPIIYHELADDDLFF